MEKKAASKILQNLPQAMDLMPSCQPSKFGVKFWRSKTM